MKIQRTLNNRFACFTPTVMLVTFFIEICLALWVTLRYKASTIVNLCVGMLVSLAVFQLAEYMVCVGDPTHADAWSRVGFFSITLLPPLGVHTASSLAKLHTRLPIYGAYLLGAAWAGVYASGRAITNHVCQGNYVIFEQAPGIGVNYSIYYYSLLVTAVVIAVLGARRQNYRRHDALYWFVAGYLLFMAPTSIVGALNEESLRGIPSIMCGFALLYALILAFKVVPKTEKVDN